MSSAVNKSQKRFMPKVSSRVPGGRAPARRLSTLRTSFSVATPQEAMSSRRQSNASSAASKRDSVSQKPTSSDVRAQLLGISPNEIPEEIESAIDDGIPATNNIEETQRNRNNDENIDLSRDSSSDADPRKRAIGKSNRDTSTLQESLPTPPQPAKPARDRRASGTASSAPNDSMNQSKALDVPAPQPVSSLPTPTVSAGTPAEPHEDTTSSITNAAPAVQEERPQAPPGCEVVWPEDLPDLRAMERRRKLMFEKELLAIMRRLYAEREKARIIDEAEEIMEEEAEAMAHSLADQATYNQLKQAVGNEAKALRDAKFAEQDDEDVENRRTLLDVNKFTMAALCKDIPVGDRNESYDDYELARVNRRRDTVRVFRAKMWSRRLYQPREEERPALKEAFKKYQDERKERSGKIKDEQKQKFTEIDDGAEENSMERHPQASIEIQANGDISLVGTQFDRHKNNRSQREGSTGPRTEVDPTEQVINSYSFSTRERPDRWTKEETAKFYEAVSALGTDFNLISHLFPMRSRNQIKTKFKYEEKRNPAKLQMFLVSKRKFSLDSYSEVSNIPIEEVGSIEGELEKVRKEHAEQMKMEEASRIQAKEEDQRKSGSKRTAQDNASGRPLPKRERVE